MLNGAKLVRVLSAFPASLESLKREALKNLLSDTGMFAGVAFADILETFRRFFTSLRFVQNDRHLPASLRLGFPAKR